ncbi:MAG: hypothetical protein ACOYU4_04045 [Thermodesulfobacteriota bacterium]
MPVFPDILPDEVTMSKHHDIENGDIQTEDDLKQLLLLMFNHPERSFYYFTEKDSKPNEFLAKAENQEAILMNKVEFFYYKHPKNNHDYVKISRNGGEFEWQKEVVKQGPMFIRIEVELTKRMKRRLEVITKNEIEKSIDGCPLEVKPGFWGISLDVPKLWRWIKRRKAGIKCR